MTKGDPSVLDFSVRFHLDAALANFLRNVSLANIIVDTLSIHVIECFFKINEEQVNRISEFCRVFRNSPHGIEVINTEKSGAEISLIFFD